MAEFTTNKSRVLLSAEGYGAKTKQVVAGLLAMCNSLSVVSTNADDEDTYSVDLSWNGVTDWLIRLENSGSTFCIHYMKKLADGTYESYQEVNEFGYVSYPTSLVVEMAQSGADLLIVGFQDDDTQAGLSFTCIRVVDQFTKAVKNAASLGSSSSGYFAFHDFYINDTTMNTTVKCVFDKNANGLTPNGIMAAIPVVIYTEDAEVPLSGFAGGTALLYYIYQGMTQKSFDTRFTKFTIDGHGFVSLGSQLCLKTM